MLSTLGRRAIAIDERSSSTSSAAEHQVSVAIQAQAPVVRSRRPRAEGRRKRPAVADGDGTGTTLSLPIRAGARAARSQRPWPPCRPACSKRPSTYAVKGDTKKRWGQMGSAFARRVISGAWRLGVAGVVAGAVAAAVVAGPGVAAATAFACRGGTVPNGPEQGAPMGVRPKHNMTCSRVNRAIAASHWSGPARRPLAADLRNPRLQLPRCNTLRGAAWSGTSSDHPLRRGHSLVHVRLDHLSCDGAMRTG